MVSPNVPIWETLGAHSIMSNNVIDTLWLTSIAWALELSDGLCLWGLSWLDS